jgi:hypothetical protein
VIMRLLTGTDKGGDRGRVVHDVGVHGRRVLVLNALNQQAEGAEVILRGMVIHGTSPSVTQHRTWMLALRT